MVFSFFGRDRGDVVFVLDVGSASVGGAFVELRKDAAPLVLRTVREKISFQDKLRHGRFLSLTFNTIESVCQKFERDPRHGRVREVQCFLSAPWCDSEMVRVKISQKEPFKATPEVLLKAVRKETAALVAKQSEEYEEEEAPVVIGADSMKVQIRGYDVSELHGQMVENMSAHVYISTMPKGIHHVIEERIRRSFPDRPVGLHSFTFAAFTFLREVLPAEETYAFLDITGEVTSILLVREGETQKETTVPFGKHVLIRSLAKKLSTTPHEAESLFALHQKGSIARPIAKKVKKVLEETQAEFLEEIAGGFQKIRKAQSIPKNIFFSADEDLAMWFKDGLEALAAKVQGDTKGVKVVFLGTTFMGRFCAFGSDVPRDAFLALAAAYAKKNKN